MFAMKSVVITLFLGICLNAVHTIAWGTYVCDLQEQGLQKIEEVCSESASKFHSPLSALESKIDRVLTFVEEMKTAEDSWVHITKRSGMVERDLSQHEETKTIDRQEDNTENYHKTTDEDGNMDDMKNEDHPEEDENENREEETTRNEDRENDNDGDNRRDRTDEYDRQNRRDRPQDHDRLDRRDRTRQNVRENQTDRTEDVNDDDDKKKDDKNDERRKKVDKEESNTGPNKGECVAQVINSHETIGMFYMMSYQHGHCANRNPIREPIRYCMGYCPTKTFIDRESRMWNQGNDCKSCQATAFETLRISLACDDGFNFEKKLQNVVDCSCRRCKPLDNKNDN